MVGWTVTLGGCVVGFWALSVMGTVALLVEHATITKISGGNKYFVIIIENSTNEFISKITGLDIEQVEKLRIEIKKLPTENSAANHKK